MTEARARQWDIGLKLIGIAGVVFSFFYGVATYRRGIETEVRKEFLKQQTAIYIDLARTAAKVAVESDASASAAAKVDFWRLYYGDARIVVDETVHARLSAFAYKLKLVSAGAAEQSELTLASFELATACRMSLSRSWDVPLSRLDTEFIEVK